MRDLLASESVRPTPLGVAGFDRNGSPTSVGMWRVELGRGRSGSEFRRRKPKTLHRC